MKKIKLTIAGLMLYGFSYSQAQDTICHSIAGKKHFIFNYYENKIINKDTSVFLGNTEIKINKNEFLVLDLYDDCKCVVNQNFIHKRNIKVYFRDGKIKYYTNSSSDSYLHFDGILIEKVIIEKPKLKESKSNPTKA